MTNFDKVLSIVREEDKAISAWNKIPASKKGYNPSVNKIISLICEQITSEAIHKYDEKYLAPYEFNIRYNSLQLKEGFVIPYEKGNNYKITTDAKTIIERIKKLSIQKDIRFVDSYFFYKITHNNDCCVISMLCSADIHDAFDIIQECLKNSGWIVTTARNYIDCGKMVTEIVIEPLLLTSAAKILSNVTEIYHITTEDRIEKIKKEGIILNKSINYKHAFCYNEPRVFFTIKNDSDEIHQICKGFMSRLLNQMNESEDKDFLYYQSPFYLITIDASKIDKTKCYCDKHNDNHFFTTDNINADAILKIEPVYYYIHKSLAEFDPIMKDYTFEPNDVHYYIKS